MNLIINTSMNLFSNKPTLILLSKRNYLRIYKWQTAFRLIPSFLARQLRHRELLITITDTVPGILTPFSSRTGMTKIYQIKKRPLEKKLLILASHLRMVEKYIADSFLTNRVYHFLEYLWPAKCTIIFPINQNIAQNLNSDQSTIAIRIPALPWLRRMIHQLGEPVFAPSANISDQPVPENVEGLINLFAKEIPLFFFPFYDWTTALPSTIIDLTRAQPILIREGAIPLKHIMQIWQQTERNHK